MINHVICKNGKVINVAQITFTEVVEIKLMKSLHNHM